MLIDIYSVQRTLLDKKKKMQGNRRELGTEHSSVRLWGIQPKRIALCYVNRTRAELQLQLWPVTKAQDSLSHSMQL